MRIYLAGNLPKDDNEAKTFDNWRSDYQDILKSHFDSEFIDPADRELDESDPMAVFGSDCRHIRDCTLVIINAEDKLGVGTSQEMVIAKYFNKPVVTVLPKESRHRKKDIVFNGNRIEDWIHPFVEVFSDFIIEHIKDIEDIKDEIFKSQIKDISMIDESIRYVDKL